MRYETIGRLVRALRQRRGWRQDDLSDRARRPRSALVSLEAGRLDRLTVGALRDFAHALDARLVITMEPASGSARVLLDAGHAFLQNLWKGRLEQWGWLVRAEVSFNHYGDRGRIDLLAFHPATGILLVIEIKTALVDIQALLGGLDVKVRVAPTLSNRFGWGRPTATIPMLVAAASSTARRRLADHAALFDPLAVRGRGATSWLRRPGSASPPSGLLALTKVPNVVYGDRNRGGRHRVRLARTDSRSAADREGARTASPQS
jgi:transcriptional regulator with XRE-family HTH domain